MTKSELKTGMIVTKRNGKKMYVYRNACTSLHSSCDILTDGNTWNDLSYYNEDLTYKNGADQDIVKVECVSTMVDLCSHNRAETLWEREEAKKMTVAEVEAILGYKVEIVSEN